MKRLKIGKIYLLCFGDSSIPIQYKGRDREGDLLCRLYLSERKTKAIPLRKIVLNQLRKPTKKEFKDVMIDDL